MLEVEFHRFSPYHKDPKHFGIRLKPSPSYFLLYPFPEESIARIAYLFEQDDERSLDRSYLKPFTDQVLRWHANYCEDDCALSWWDQEGDVYILDRRADFESKLYRLQEFAAATFRALDSPRSLSALVMEAKSGSLSTQAGDSFCSPFGSDIAKAQSMDQETIRFSAEEFVKDPTRCVTSLVSAGLLYIEESLSHPLMEAVGVLGPAHVSPPNAVPKGPSYLALPVRDRRKPINKRWMQITT